MKLFTTAQVADLDKYTIVNEPIEPIDLMERASMQVADWMAEHINYNHRIAIFAGPGNNGGDAYTAGIDLIKLGFSVKAIHPYPLEECSFLCQEMHRRFVESGGLVQTTKLFELEGVLLDGLVGTGFQGKAEGGHHKL